MLMNPAGHPWTPLGPMDNLTLLARAQTSKLEIPGEFVELFRSLQKPAAFFFLLLTEMGCAHGTAVNANEFKHGGHMVEPDVTWPKHLGEKAEIPWIFWLALKVAYDQST